MNFLVKKTRKRIRLKRPFFHHIIIIAYAMAPFVSLVLFCLVNSISFYKIGRDFFGFFGMLGSLVLISAPLVAIGLYFVHKISWYIFLSNNILLLLDIHFKLLNFRAVYHVSLLVSGIVLIGILNYILQKDFRAPYFHGLPRGWRESKRYQVDLMISLNGKPKQVGNLSIGGCFIPETNPEIGLGEAVSIQFKKANLNIDCMGEVVRLGPDGYGIRFLSIPVGDKKNLNRLLKSVSSRHGGSK